MTDNQKIKRIRATAKRKKDTDIAKLKEQAEFLDRQAAEDAIHRKPPSIGISSQEPELELGRRIHEAREAAKLTQGEFAELTKQADADRERNLPCRAVVLRNRKKPSIASRTEDDL